MPPYDGICRSAESRSEAGYKNPDRASIELMTRDDISGEISRLSENSPLNIRERSDRMRSVQAAACAGIGDPLTLVRNGCR